MLAPYKGICSQCGHDHDHLPDFKAFETELRKQIGRELLRHKFKPFMELTTEVVDAMLIREVCKLEKDLDSHSEDTTEAGDEV